MDLVPQIARLFFTPYSEKLKLPISLSFTQAVILCGIGLQCKSVDQLSLDLNLQASQILPMFNKAMKKATRIFKSVYEHQIQKEFEEKEKKTDKLLKASQVGKSLAEELDEGNEKAKTGAKQDLDKL